MTALLHRTAAILSAFVLSLTGAAPIDYRLGFSLLKTRPAYVGHTR